MNKISKIALSLTAVASLSSCGTKPQRDHFDEIYDLSNRVSDVLSSEESYYDENSNHLLNNDEKLNHISNSNDDSIILNKESLDFIGKNELSFFNKFFNIKSENNFISKVKDIQNNAGLENDGIIGPNTLKLIYLNYYSKINSTKLPLDIKNRLEIYKEMEGYKSHKGKQSNYGLLFPTDVPDIFSKNYFYGLGKKENIGGTFINEDLYKVFKKEIPEGYPIAVLVNVNGKYMLSAYINHKLVLATYVSPGDPNLSGAVLTKKGEFKTRRHDKYYISGAKDSIKQTSDGLKGAIMPYALHVTGGIFAHAGYVSGQRRSHGCIRLPIYYAKGLYDLYKENGSLTWEVQSN